MWLIELFKAIFQFGTSANEVAKKALPSEKIQEEKFGLRKGTISVSETQKIADKRNRLADEMFHDLRHHPELSVMDKVNYECAELNEEGRTYLIRIITERLNSDSVYQRAKNKKSKFKP